MKDIPYDAWLHWFITMRCNLDCEYCFKNPIKKTARLNAINISKVMECLDQSRKRYLISLTGGGEPFLIPNLNEFCGELTQKHYLSINTNLTSLKIQEFVRVVQPGNVIEVHASLHIEELIRKKLVDRFVENYQLLKKHGIPIRTTAVAHPGLRDRINKYRSLFLQKAIEFKFEPYIGVYDHKPYPNNYTEDELKAFDLNHENLNIFASKSKICNAGFNAGIVMPNGKIYTCMYIGKSLGDINRAIHFTSYLIKCPIKKCECPLNHYGRNLLQKVMIDKNIPLKKPSRILNCIGRMKMGSNYVRD